MKTNINIDYLILNIKLDDPKLDFDSLRNEIFSFRILQYGTQNFQRIGEIYFRGSHFATMTFSPYAGSIIKPNFAQVQMVNRWLYEPLNWLKNTIIEMVSWLGGTVLGLNRLDLAIDGLQNQIFHNDMPNLHSCVTVTEEYILAGKEKDFDMYSSSKGTKKGWKLGSRSGDRMLRFYNKSLEIIKKPKKHILEYWKYNIGFDSEEQQRVWRMEYQLNRRFLKPFDGERWITIFDRKMMLAVFKDANKTFLDIRENRNLSRVTNNTKMQLIDWSGIGNNLEVDELFKREARPESIYAGKQVRELKMTLKKMFWLYWRGMQTSNLSLVFVNKIFDLNHSYFEDTFFNNKAKIWVQEFEQREKFQYSFDWNQCKIDIKSTAGIEI